MKQNGFIISNKVAYSIPPKASDESTAFDLYEHDTLRSLESSIEDSTLHRYGEGSFSMKIGGTTFDVNTHFSTEGKESILQQFKTLILSEHLI